MPPLDISLEADLLQIELFRRMGPEKRLQAGIALSQTCRKLLAAGVRRRHPGYGEDEVRLAVFGSFSRKIFFYQRTLTLGIFGHDP